MLGRRAWRWEMWCMSTGTEKCTGFRNRKVRQWAWSGGGDLGGGPEARCLDPNHNAPCSPPGGLVDVAASSGVNGRADRRWLVWPAGAAQAGRLRKPAGRVRCGETPGDSRSTSSRVH